MSVGVLPILREAFSHRTEWRGFPPRQPSVLMFLHGYTPEPAEVFESRPRCRSPWRIGKEPRDGPPG